MKKLALFCLLFLHSSFSHASQLSGHHLGLGMSGYVFMDDLKEQFNNTVGFTAAYEYTLPFLSAYEPGIGLRVEYYVPRKNGFVNENILITPELSLLVYNGYFPLGISLGMDANFWKQTKTYIRKEVFHEDLLYGMSVGLFSRTGLAPWGHIEYSLAYHLLQMNFQTTFLAIGVQYVWDFNRK